MRPGLRIARRLGTRSSSERTNAIMKKIDMEMGENDETTLEELRLPLQNQHVGFHLTFSIVTELRSVMDNKANGHQSTPVRSTVNTRTVI